MRVHPTFKMMILWISLGLLSGCAYAVIGGAAAGGTYAYVAGWLHKDYEESLEQTYEASLEAMQDLEIRVETKTLSLSKADVRGKKGDETITVKMEKQSGGVVKVSVRVGLLGDEQASREVHEAIADNL